MPVPSVDPIVSVKDLVKTNWVAANVTGTTTPDFHTGWFNPKSSSPQMTFSGRSEAFEGQTGYGAIGASGPVQIANGVLFVNCWAYRDDSGVSPKKLVHDMAEEVRRIVLANYDTIADLDYVSITAVDDVAPPEGIDPMVFRKAITVGFRWRTT